MHSCAAAPLAWVGARKRTPTYTMRSRLSSPASMRRHVAVLVALVAVTSAGTAAVAKSAAEPLGPAAVTGSWGLVGSGTVGGITEGELGLVSFDGARTCTGEIDTNRGGTTTQSRAFTTCSYEIGKDGRGRLTAVLDDGSSFSVAMTVARGGGEVFYISTEPRSAKSGSLFRQFTGKSYAMTATQLKGVWNVRTDAKLGELPVVFVGVASFDGRGTCSLTVTENNPVERFHDHHSTSCAYSIEANGRGTFTTTLDDGVTETRSLVVTDDGDRVSFLVTPDLPTALGVGEMIRQ